MFDKAEISNRIARLRNDRGLSQRELAEAVHVCTATINKCESAERMPSLETLITLAEFFHVSTDYVLGVTKEENVKVGRKIKAIRENQNMSRAELAKKVRVREDVINEIEAGTTIPKQAQVRHICKALNITESDLMDASYSLSGELSEWVNKAGSLPYIIFAKRAQEKGIPAQAIRTARVMI